jgi:hypothetical protein
MAISAGMALMSTAVGALGAGGAVSLSFASIFGATSAIGMMASHFLVTTAIGAAINALSPKPKSAASGYSVTTTSSVADHQIIYGKTKVAGVRVFDGTTGDNNRYLHRVLAFAGHEIESFEEIYLNDELVTIDGSGNVTSPDRYDGYVRINTHLGSDDQLADSDLVSEVTSWTNKHRLRGIAYLYIRYDFNQDVFPNGVPEVTAVIKGKKVYDPRTETTAWSDNPALCIRDYLLNTRYGLGETSDNIDDTLFTTAANVCDYYDYPTLTGDQRYTTNGSFTTGSNPYDLLQNLLSSMGGLLWYAQGKWRTKPAYWTAPSVAFTEDDLRSSISVTTRHSRRDNFNTVNGVWKGEESNWQLTDFPPVSNDDFVAADNGQETVTDLNLAFTSDVGMARRIANVYLERNRQQLTVQASFGMRAFQVQVGDNIKLTNNRFGWAEKEFEVVSWTFGLVDNSDLQVQMILREISEGVFDDISDGAIYEKDNTTLPSPFIVTPIGIDVEAVAQVANQKVSNIALVTITALSDVFISKIEVEYKKTSDSNWKSIGVGPIGVFEAVDLEVGNFDFRARATNTFGVKGDWVSLLDQEINAFIGDPSDVDELNFEVSGGTLFLTWPAIPDADLSHYVIKHNSATSGAVWGNSTTIIEKIPRPATQAALPARSGTYLIKAYDKEDNFSEGTTTVVVLPSDLPQLGTTDTVTEDPTFAGTKTNTVVVSSSLEIDDTSAASPSGVYEFASYIDTGSSRNARITGYNTLERRYDNGTLLWDIIPQNWDTWPDTWDTWTNENANFGDVGVVIEVATTDDDPAGTPTWSSWVLANGGYVVGRAFKFRANLTSTNSYYTPAVLTLSADVEY